MKHNLFLVLVWMGLVVLDIIGKLQRYSIWLAVTNASVRLVVIRHKNLLLKRGTGGRGMNTCKDCKSRHAIAK